VLLPTKNGHQAGGQTTFLGAEEEEGREREREGKTKMFIQKAIIMPPDLVNRIDNNNARADVILLWLFSRVCDLR
jgi:hypothetical protein